MNATVEQVLITKIKALSPQQVAEVVDFVDFLAAKSAKRAALDRLLEAIRQRGDVQLVSSAALLEELA
jgi:hypothetical protein